MSNSEFTIQNQVIFANKLAAAKLAARNSVINEVAIIAHSDLKSIKGIGDKTIKLLLDNNIASVQDLELVITNSPTRFTEIISSPISRNQIRAHIESLKGPMINDIDMRRKLEKEEAELENKIEEEEFPIELTK